MPLRSRWTAALIAVTVAVLPVLTTACNDDDPAVNLSAEGKLGARVATANNCSACHSTNGDELTGPTWEGLYGSVVTLQGGKQVTVDDAYLTEAVREPNALRRDDATGQMPAFDEDRISDEDLQHLIAYLKDLA